MKKKLLLVQRTGALGSILALAFVAGASLSTSVLAKPPEGKGGGNGGGGSGGDEPTDPGGAVTINPVPDTVTPPIGYTATEIPWNGDVDGNGVADKDEADWFGVSFNGINNQGVVVSYIAGPTLDPAYPGWVVGGINIDPASGEIAGEMFDLNEVFAGALAAMNQARADDGPWRIAYGRSVTDGGLVALQLVPQDAGFNDPALNVPCLLAVGDLARRSKNDGIMVIPINTNGENDHLQLTELGNSLVLEYDPGLEGYYIRIFLLGENSDGERGYFAEMPVPAVGYLEEPTIRDPGLGDSTPYPDLCYTPWTSNQVVRYSYSDDAGPEEVVLHELIDTFFEAGGLAPAGPDGAAYACAQTLETIGKGKNKETIAYWTPHYIISPTERTPLAAPLASACLPEVNWSISDAWLPGEEEVVIEFEDTGEVQVFKPNFGALFQLPIDPGTQRLIEISPPVDPLAVSSHYTLGNGDYAAGYVGYGTEAEPDRVIVLTPDGAPIPGE